MEGLLLQDWTTVRVSGATSIVQSELLWLYTEGYRDIVFWLEARNVSLGGAVLVEMAYETSPTKDESLFGAMISAFSFTPHQTPTITKILAQSSANPVSNWVRWKLVTVGTPTSEWGATFRIHCALNMGGLG